MGIDLKKIVRGQQAKPPKMVIYGVGGVGKTTFAAGARKPIFLFTEEGLGALDVARFEPRPDDPVLRSWEEIIECVGALYTEDHDYETVVLDSADFAEPLLWKFTAEKWEKTAIEDFGYGKGYVYALDEARVLTEGLEHLRNEKGMAVIIISHCEVKKFEPPDSEAYSEYSLRLQSRLASHLHDWADFVGFATYKTALVKDQQGKGKDAKSRTRATGTGERVLYTQKRPAFWAKNHYHLPFELPLNYPAFEAAFIAGMAKEAADKRARDAVIANGAKTDQPQPEKVTQ